MATRSSTGRLRKGKQVRAGVLRRVDSDIFKKCTNFKKWAKRIILEKVVEEVVRGRSNEAIRDPGSYFCGCLRRSCMTIHLNACHMLSKIAHETSLVTDLGDGSLGTHNRR